MAATHFLKHLTCALCSRNFSLALPLLHARFRHFSLRRPSAFIRNIASTSSSTTVTDSYASQYLSVRIQCQKGFVDVLSEALLSFGASSTSVDEEDGCDISTEICINTIFPEGEDVARCISHAADSVGLKEIPHFEVHVGEQSDWLKKTQESFRPVKVTEGLWIVPEWITPPDSKATNIVLNPELAFGTGEHPTTRLCLLLLHRLVKGGEHFFDYGTGTGILAIAAVKFGAALSVGIDIDPQAITSGQKNAALNDIGPEKMHVHLVTTSMDGKECIIVEEYLKDNYDVVIANILLNPLLDLADHIVFYAKPDSVVGLSGILSEQIPQIIERYSHYLEKIAVSEMDGWACVSGRKKRNIAEN